MSLGRSLFGSLGRRKRKEKKPSVIKTVGAVAATAFILAKLFEKHGGSLFSPSAPEEEPKKLANYKAPEKSGKEVKLEPSTYNKLKDEAGRQKSEFKKQQVQNADEDYIYAQLGELALCWYMASVDGGISPQERAELEPILNGVKNNENIPQVYKDAIIKEILGPSLNFNTVTKYLDHADPVELIELSDDVEELVRIDGVTEREQYALDAFRHYVEQRTGHKFEQAKKTQSLMCPNCGAAMSVSQDNSTAICEYCGYKMLVK